MLQRSELIEKLEGVLCVRVAVALTNNLRVQEGPAWQVDVRERSVVPILALPVELESCDLAFGQSLRERAGLSPERLDRLRRMNILGGVDADQADGTNAFDSMVSPSITRVMFWAAAGAVQAKTSANNAETTLDGFNMRRAFLADD